MITPISLNKMGDYDSEDASVEEEGYDDPRILGMEECMPKQFVDDIRRTALDDEADLNSVSTTDEHSSHREVSDSEGSKIAPMATRETYYVNFSKLIVDIVLVLVAASFGVATYLILTKEEDNSFRTEFRSVAKEIITLANNHALSTAGVVVDLATTLTSAGMNSGSKYPFYTMPDFERRTEQALRLTGAHVIATVPIVEGIERASWEEFATREQGWIKEGLEYSGNGDVDPGTVPNHIYDSVLSDGFYKNNDTNRTFLPLWQMGPAPTNASQTLVDLSNIEWIRNVTTSTKKLKSVVISPAVEVDYLLQRTWDHPHSVIIDPFFDSFEDDAKAVGFVATALCWNFFFNGLLREGIDDYLVHVEDGCGAPFTYRMEGEKAFFLGYGDCHEKKYDELYETAGFLTENHSGEQERGTRTKFISDCDYRITVYPTSELEDSFKSKNPIVYTVIVVCAFIFTAAVFTFYDLAVRHRQEKVMTTAQQTTAIVASLFPKAVQERMMQEVQEKIEQAASKKRGSRMAPKAQMRQFLHGDESGEEKKGESFLSSKPIADLFPEATIMFADIVGFTAWSSMREPSQVFMLLENIYHAFDEIAKRRRVFKVETIGDCYVAVAGLPEPRSDHAVAMARFARQCLNEASKLFKQLEETLGPDTGDLGMRFGLHSGPVTAGVLRGDRARFQLFGDSVNTASRMESNGERNRIQISQATADKLAELGKSRWFFPREDKIVAKGKGELQTYWLDPRGSSSGGKTPTVSSGSCESSSQRDEQSLKEPEEPLMDFQFAGSRINTEAKLSDKYLRLVKWNTDILSTLLKQILAGREACGVRPEPKHKIQCVEEAVLSASKERNVLEEVEDIICLPNFQPETMRKRQSNIASVELSEDVEEQLRQYVQTIAILYNDNPFHSFAHACQMAMSVTKLLSRIVAPDELDNMDEEGDEKTLYDHTYGITSDPLTQFAVVFSALIHDVSHPGVSNAQLVKEGVSIALAYKNKSVAEQNSFDIAWQLLMEPCFSDLRNAIYATESEFRRFRQLVANIVMATDIMDKDLGAVRKERWNKAFAEGNIHSQSRSGILDELDRNRKATIVIEHVIQASDVAHTMQHWHIYRKWNAFLFEEMYKAYKEGRATKDPTEFWYAGEIGFFDNYIIPLAKKLKDCGVFGVSSDEYLSYALQNRREWESKGQELVAELSESMKNKLK